MGARRAAAHRSGRERDRQRTTPTGSAHLRRGSRAPLRDRVGHRRRRASGDKRASGPIVHRPRHAAGAAEAGRGRLVPRLLARHLRRRPPGPRCVHVRRRAERRACATVPGAVDVGVRCHATAGRGPLGRVPLGDDGDRSARAAARDRTARGAARARCAAAGCLRRVLSSLRPPHSSRSRSTRCSRPRTSPCDR